MKATNDTYRELFLKTSCGFLTFEIKLDHAGTPLEFLISELNPVAESVLDKKTAHVAGKSIADVLQESFKDTDPDWLDTFQQVAKTGVSGEMEFFSENLQRWYKIHVIRINANTLATMFIDITKETEQIIECLETDYKLRIESRLRELLMEIASTYVNLPLESVESTIQKSLADMAMFVHADRAYIFDFNEQDETCTNTHEWCGQGISPQIDDLQNVPLASEWIRTFRKGEQMYIPDVSSLPPGLAKEVLEPQEIKSLLAIPLMQDSICIGFVGFDSVLQSHTYSESEQQILSIFAQMLVNIRLRKAAEEELIRAKEKAEESDRLKSAFLANMSHEIRTPMNGILGFSQLLKEPGLNCEEQQEYIHVIEQSGERMLNVINDLINISKIEAGQMDVTISKTNINEQLDYLHTFFKPEADRKGLQLTRSCPFSQDQAYIETDREKLYAIMTNLIKNAHKFTEKGSIEFGYELKDDDILFFVKDTGIGIPENKLKEVFGRFVQADTSFTSDYEGSGLGLAICKAYAELLGGTIWLESEHGLGSTFFFTIPYRPASENIYRYLIDNNPDIIREKHQSTNVLIVDNDKISRLGMVKMIEKVCDTYRTAQSGEEAIELCRKNQDINLVLMDIKMPGMDGYEATRIIREFNNNIVIVAQTALTLATDRDKALAAGCNEYITKPIQPATLAEIINKYFIGS